MKLSEAIRLGAMLKPQGHGRIDRGGSTCALGAALEAVGERMDRGWFPVYDRWPVACLYVSYPGKCYRGQTMLVGSSCWILNDADRWTREQIADWVESIEHEQEAEQAQPVAVEIA